MQFRSVLWPVAVVAISSVSVAPARASSGESRQPAPSLKPVCSQLSNVQTGTQGDRVYTYDLRGKKIKMTVPAESFDARTASPQRIKEAGYPARPKSGTKASTRWMRAFGHPSPRSTGAPPGPCVLPGVEAAAATSWNYNGYRGLDANTDKIDEVSMAYTAPTYTDAQCSADSFTDWTGIYDNTVTPNKLVQTGMYVIHYTSTLIKGAFWEIVGGALDTGGLVQIPNVGYTPGHFYSFTVYIDTVDSLNAIYFNINDSTAEETGDFSHDATIEYNDSRVSDYLARVAFFTSERMREPSGQLSTYMKAAGHKFKYAGADFMANWVTLSSMNQQAYTMTSKDFLTTLGTSGAVSSVDDSFTASWKACGSVE
jgi:hypothetical protein